MKLMENITRNMTDPENVSAIDHSGLNALLVIISFLILVVLSILGNMMVLVVILNSKGMRTVTNYFLFNLSAGDLLIVFSIVPNVYYALQRDWIFGVVYCKWSQFFTAFNIAISVFTFIGITADRYAAIMYPLRRRSSPKTVGCYISLIWLSAFVVGFPGLMFGTVSTEEHSLSQTLRNSNSGLSDMENTTDQFVYRPMKRPFQRQCFLALSKDFLEIYDYALFVLMYVLPLFTLFATYVPISIRLWFHREIGEVTRAQVENIRSKRRAVKMMCVVMLIFAVCWLPYQLFFIVLRIRPQYYNHPHVGVVFIVFYWLAMSNAVHNPIIYFTMNRRFRNGLFRILPCFACTDRIIQQTTVSVAKDTRVSLRTEHRNANGPPQHYGYMATSMADSYEVEEDG